LELPSQSSPFTNLTRNFISSWRTLDNPPPFKITRNGWKNRWEFNVFKIVRYTKLRYQDWLFAGGEDSGEKFFIILWDPKALEAIEDQTRILITGLNFSRTGPRQRISKRRDPSLRGRGRTGFSYIILDST
jgi:hypothetical protein